jgi:hypothetical protein
MQTKILIVLSTFQNDNNNVNIEKEKKKLIYFSVKRDKNRKFSLFNEVLIKLKKKIDAHPSPKSALEMHQVQNVI